MTFDTFQSLLADSFSLAKLSKKVIRQDRPYTAVPAENATPDTTGSNHTKDSPRHPKKVKKTYGMPSTHSTSIAYFMTYIVLSLPPFQRSLTNHSALDLVMLLGTLAWGIAIMWSRIYLGYHTWQQGAVGGAIGFGGGAAWRYIWDGVVLPGGLDSQFQHLINRCFSMIGC
jgi:membrane-associated phospholipid phosphatase